MEMLLGISLFLNLALVLYLYVIKKANKVKIKNLEELIKCNYNKINKMERR